MARHGDALALANLKNGIERGRPGWEGCGELAGARTQDPRLKRALLYQLSYELDKAACSKVPQGNVEGLRD